MYKIIGGDQKEYGPSTAEEIRLWVAEGRANAQTLVQFEGSNEWKPLASYPEFAGLNYPAPAPSLSPPGAIPPFPASTTPQSYTALVLSSRPRLSIGSCMNRGWHTLVNNFGLLFPATLMICGVRLFLSLVPVIGVMSLLFTGVFYGGLYLVFLKRIRGQPTSIGEAFSGFGENFTQLLLVGIISLLLTFIGLVFCILPGILLFIMWVFAIPLVADKKLGYWDAMDLSRKVVAKNWFQIAALLLLCFLPLILFTIYSNLVMMHFISSLVDSGQLDFSLFLNNPPQFLSQVAKASQLMMEKYLYLGLFQQLLMLLVQPFAKAVLMHAYEVLFNPRPAPPA